jgi:hypothetical protein
MDAPTRAWCYVQLDGMNIVDALRLAMADARQEAAS